MKVLPAVTNSIRIEYEDANKGFLNAKVKDITPFNGVLKDNLIVAKYHGGVKVKDFKDDDILVIKTEFIKWDGCIYAFTFRGHLLVRELQFLPFGTKYNKQRGYRSVGVEFDEFFSYDEVDFIGLVVGKISQYHGGVFKTPFFF